MDQVQTSGNKSGGQSERHRTHDVEDFLAS